MTDKGDNMKANKITFEYSVTKTYKVELTESNFDMPENIKDLISTIEELKNDPDGYNDKRLDYQEDSETKFIDYDVE
jgi:hypothetical protein